MSWVDFANHFLSNQRLHAWSWINRTFSWEWFVSCRKFGFEYSWPFPFLFSLVRGEQVTDAQDSGWQSKGEDHFRSWFPFFLCLLGDDSVFVQMSSSLKTFLHISFVFFRSLIGNFLSFLFLLSLNLWLGISFSFLFAFSQSLIGIFSFFVFFRGQGLTSSPWAKVHGELGFWLSACRTDGHDICMVWFGSRIKGDVPHYFHDTNATMMIWKFYAKLVMHAPMWTLKWKFFGHVMLGLIIHFLYFSQPSVSKICSFINLCIHPSLFLSVRENSHNVHPLGVHTFFQKLVMIKKNFHREVGSYLFPQACCFLARQLLFLFISTLHFFLPSFVPFFSFFTFPFLSYYHLFIFFPLSKRSCERGRILPTYV